MVQVVAAVVVLLGAALVRVDAATITTTTTQQTTHTTRTHAHTQSAGPPLTVTNGATTYVLSSTFADATDAEANCEKIGMKLASVNTVAENEVIATALASFNRPHEALWLGGQRNLSGTLFRPYAWQWIDGSAFNFSAWNTVYRTLHNEPNNLKGQEYCIAMVAPAKARTKGAWKDEDCSQRYRYVCEISTSLTTTTTATPANGPSHPGTSCKTLHDNDKTLSSGIYWIAPDGVTGNSYQAYCDMTTDGGGWTMVYKFTALNGNDVAQLWNSATPVETSVDVLNTVATPLYPQYVNSIVTDLWNAGGFTVSEARVHVLNHGDLKKFLKFSNLASTDKTSWFAIESLNSSSWTDLNTSQVFQNFGIVGDQHSSYTREWFVFYQYDQCFDDHGWLAVIMTGVCGWESAVTGRPYILYSKLDTLAYFQDSGTQSADVGHADVLAVFVR